MAWPVVPDDDHRLDAKPWLQRCPTMYVAAPAGAREKALEALCKVLGGDWSEDAARNANVASTAP